MIAASLMVTTSICSGSVFGAEKKVSANSLAPGMVSVSNTSAKPLNMNALHRLDFMVVGKRCATCLFKIQKRLQALPAVAKVGVMLRKPYGAVCIYDATKSDKDSLLKVAK